MDNEYKLLIEDDKIFIEMFIQILDQNKVLYVVESVYGTGVSMSTGVKERLKVFVLEENFDVAKDLLDNYFLGNRE